MTEKNVWQFAGELQKFVFQILKIYKGFSYFDYNSTIRKKKYTELCTCLKIRSYGSFC